MIFLHSSSLPIPYLSNLTQISALFNAQFYKQSSQYPSFLYIKSSKYQPMQLHQANIDKAEQQTNLDEHNQYNNAKNHKVAHENQTDGYQIDHKQIQMEFRVLPFIFRFNYSALQRLRLKMEEGIPKLAEEIFHYLKEKLVVRRYSEGGKYPNRMKYEEKVKFLIRAFDHRRNTTVPDPDRRKQKFNRQKQIQFFSREEVRQNFMEEIEQALIKKRAENERRIKQIQDCIEMAINLSFSEPERAFRIFEQRIKRKQLPWTDNMFSDLQDFSKQLFYRYTREPRKATRNVQGKGDSSSVRKQKEMKELDEQQIEDYELNEEDLSKFQCCE